MQPICKQWDLQFGGDLVVDRMLAERGCWPVGSREEAMIWKRATVGASISYGGDIL